MHPHYEASLMTSRRQFMAAGVGSVLASCSAPWCPAETLKNLPKALLLGDSISIGYTDFVVGILLGTVDVSRPLNKNGGYENCEGTTKAVQQLDEWLGDGTWDVIHFNFGLHDLKHVDAKTGRNSRNPQDPQQATQEQYRKNLLRIVERLLVTKAKLIFATTTPFRENLDNPAREVDQPQKYNEVALSIMKRNGIMIDDLYNLVLPRMTEFLPPRNVHPNKACYLAMAQQVAAHIEKALAS